jgi:Flp pilus assembly protein TadG
VVYFALGLMVFLGMTGLAVDVGHLYHNRAKAQRAADAAALAGAVKLAYSGNKASADAAARSAAIANGYDVDAANVNFATANPAFGNPSWYNVTISRTEPLFFMAVFGSAFRNRLVGAGATALYEQPVNLNISGNGTYGAQGPMNLSVFGPMALHSNGDMYSTKFYNDKSPNEKYLSSGFDFNVQIPSNYRQKNGSRYVDIEVFDPDCYNNGGTDANGTDRVDEYRNGPFSSAIERTTTRYTLYYTNNTPDPSDDYEIATTTYDGNNSDTDMQWVQPSGFRIDVRNRRWRNDFDEPNAFRINVQSIAGASENGFNLRAGPPRGANEDFDPNNGTDITGSGRLPINFNTSGTVTVQLGYVPATATQITVDKFDTDVGSKSVIYTDGTYSYTGVLTKNDEFLPDVLQLPANYPGGNWTARYTAGAQDTSSWSMRYTGPSLNRPGLVRLVK